MKRSDIDQEMFSKDMKDFDTRMRVLRAEFNQYLNGTLKFPPRFTEAQIRKIIKKYAAARELRGFERFQYYNLVSKFNTMMEFYSRRIREKQEGKRTTYGYIRPANEAGNAKKTALTPKNIAARKYRKPSGHIISNVKLQTGTVKAMFEAWNEVSSMAKSPPPNLNFETFKMMIQKKTDQIRAKKGIRAVRYRVMLEDGKVRIKAKTIK